MIKTYELIKFKGINEFIAASPDEIIQKVSFVDTYAYILPANVNVELIRELVQKYHDAGKRYNFGDLLDEASIEHYREAWDAERWDRDCIVVFPNDNVEWAICEMRDLEYVEAIEYWDGTEKVEIWLNDITERHTVEVGQDSAVELYNLGSSHGMLYRVVSVDGYPPAEGQKYLLHEWSQEQGIVDSAKFYSLNDVLPNDVL